VRVRDTESLRPFEEFFCIDRIGKTMATATPALAAWRTASGRSVPHIVFKALQAADPADFHVRLL
jgi:hypothetical protein